MKNNVKINTEWRKENAGFMAILKVLTDRWGFHSEKYAHESSPISLTTAGTTLLKESGAEEYIERNKESLLKRFKDIAEPYDIQKKAEVVMVEECMKNKGIKSFVYRNGGKMVDVASVASIALRDIILKERNIQTDNE